MEDFKVNKDELERFKSSYHAQTGSRIDDDMALFYFEITRDRKLVIDICSNTGLIVEDFINFEKEASEKILKSILNLQKGVEELTVRTDEKRASFLSVILRFYHNRSVFMRYIIIFFLTLSLVFPSYFSFLIYNEFKSLKSNRETFKFSSTNIKGTNYKTANLPDGAYVKKGILYVPE